MDEQQTCGKGLASNASLPDKLGALTGAVADILEAHMPALDLTDPAAAQEHAAYAQLVAEHRAAAGDYDHRSTHGGLLESADGSP